MQHVIHKVTVDDYRAMPETGPRYQLIDGELIRMSPAPSLPHQDAALALATALRLHARALGLGVVAIAPVDVYLSEHDVVQPDVLFVSNARRDRIALDGVHGAPDLVCEVLSPSTRHLDLGVKRDLYARHGVIEMWTVDLDDETVSIYRLQEDAVLPARTIGRGNAILSKLLPGLELPVDELFR